LIGAFIHGGTGISIPEMILLSFMFKNELLFAFMLNAFQVAIVTGYLVECLLYWCRGLSGRHKAFLCRTYADKNNELPRSELRGIGGTRQQDYAPSPCPLPGGARE